MKIILSALTVLLVASAASGQYTGPTNQAGLDLIKEFEGWYPNFYTDPVGIRTIGYGHACHVWDCSVPLNGKYPVPLSLADGQSLLAEDLVSYEACVRNNVRYSGLNADQFSALTSFTFNLGCGNLQSSTLLSLLNSGNVLGASEEFGKWVYGGGVVLPGLVRRREAERVLFCSNGACGGGGGGGCKGTATDSLNVRAEPNTSSAIVGGVSPGSTVTIGSRTTGTNVSGNSYWFNIGNGYVSAFYISISSSNGEAWCSTS